MPFGTAVSFVTAQRKIKRYMLHNAKLLHLATLQFLIQVSNSVASKS